MKSHFCKVGTIRPNLTKQGIRNSLKNSLDKINDEIKRNIGLETSKWYYLLFNMSSICCWSSLAFNEDACAKSSPEDA